MKPDWKDAPAWAKFLAMDGDDGIWYWFEAKPIYCHNGNFWACTGDTKFMAIDQTTNSLNSLEERPNE